MADSLASSLRNACDIMNTMAYSKEEYSRLAERIMDGILNFIYGSIPAPPVDPNVYNMMTSAGLRTVGIQIAIGFLQYIPAIVAQTHIKIRLVLAALIIKKTYTIRHNIRER